MNRKQLADTAEFLAELEREQTRLVRCLVHTKWITIQVPRDLSDLDLTQQDRASLEAIRAARLEVDVAEAVDPDVIELLKALAGMPNKLTETDPATGKQRPRFECVGCQSNPSPRRILMLAVGILVLAIYFMDIYLIQERSRAMQALRAEIPMEASTAGKSAAPAPQ